MSELNEIRRVFEGLHTLYEIHLPKVHPKLIHDLLMRIRNNPRKDPFYLIEVFTKPEVNSEEMRTYIITKTGMNPTIHDSGTHYAFNNKLTLEFLKELSDLKDVIAVYGDFMATLAPICGVTLGEGGAAHDSGENLVLFVILAYVHKIYKTNYY